MNTDGENLRKRFDKLKREKGISRAAFAKMHKLKGADAMIYQHINDLKPISLDAGLVYAKGFDCELSEISERLAQEVDDLNKKLSAKEDPDLPHPTDDEFAMVPQLDIAASCGDGCFHDHVVVKGGLAFKRSSLREFGIPEAAARIIYAKGGSMWPSVKDGCVVLLNTAEKEPKDGRVFAICTPDGDLVLKRLVWEFHPAMGAQTWVMRSDNPDKTAHPDKILPPDDRTMIVGLAVWNDNRL